MGHVEPFFASHVTGALRLLAGVAGLEPARRARVCYCTVRTGIAKLALSLVLQPIVHLLPHDSVPAPAGTAIGANGAENKASGDMITTIPISSARLVKNGEHSGAWEKGVIAVSSWSAPFRLLICPSSRFSAMYEYGPMLAIQGTGQFAVFSGLWAILSVDAPRKTVLCHVPMYEGDE